MKLCAGSHNFKRANGATEDVAKDDDPKARSHFMTDLFSIHADSISKIGAADHFAQAVLVVGDARSATSLAEQSSSTSAGIRIRRTQFWDRLIFGNRG